MSDDGDSPSDSTQEPQEGDSTGFSVLDLILYGVVRRIIPDKVIKAAALDLPEVVHRSELNRVSSELETKATALAAEIDSKQKAWDDARVARKETKDIRSASYAIADKRRQAEANLKAAQEQFRGGLNVHRKEMVWVTAAYERQRSLAGTLAAYDLIQRVREPVLLVDRKNRIITASPAFLKALGINEQDLLEQMPEHLHGVVPNENMEVGKELASIATNSRVIERYVEVADYFLPGESNYHLSMGLELKVGEKTQRFVADAVVATMPVPIKGKQGWRYDGALIELTKPKGLLRRSAEALLSYFRNKQAYGMPEGKLTEALMKDVIRNIGVSFVNSPDEDRDKYPVLVDFSNVASIDAGAVKAAINFYEHMHSMHRDKFLVVPGHLRGLFFNAGLPPSGMMLPDDYKDMKEPLTAPGLLPEQA